VTARNPDDIPQLVPALVEHFKVERMAVAAE
jgi:hypothetical protein